MSFNIFLAGKNRPTLLVFNPGLTSLKHFLLSAAVILTYICQSTRGLQQLGEVTMEPPPLPPVHILQKKYIFSSFLLIKKSNSTKKVNKETIWFPIWIRIMSLAN